MNHETDQQPPTPATGEQAAKEYVKNLQISSASIDPRRDRDRYLGFLAGLSFKEEWVSEGQILKGKIKMLEEMKEWAAGSMDNGASGDEILYSHNDFFSDMDTWIKRCEDRLLEINNEPQPPKTDK